MVSNQYELGEHFSEGPGYHVTDNIIVSGKGKKFSNYNIYQSKENVILIKFL